MKYINFMTGEVCNSLWKCICTYWHERKICKSWTWMRLNEYNKYIDKIIWKGMDM